MRILLVLFTSIISMPACAGALDDARKLGAPMESWSEPFSCREAKSFRERTFSLFLIFRNLQATAVSFSSI